MHLPYSSLIFSLKGALKFCRQLSIYSFYQVKGQQKRLNCWFKCIFLVEYLFSDSLSETDKKLLFSSSTSSFVGWSTLINISGTKLDLVFHFARFLREEPQMVHFCNGFSVLDSPISPSRYIYY